MNLKMNLTNKFFNLLDVGSKDIEIRLLDEKRTGIKIGDTITFNNSTNYILTEIINIYYFNSFEELLDYIPLERIGLDESKEKALNELMSIYPRKKIGKHKIIAIELERRLV